MATAEMEPEVVAEAAPEVDPACVETPPEDKPAATPESENERILREIAAQEEVVAGRERIVDDCKSKLKEAKDDYEDAVLCLRHLCRSKANDDDRPLLKPGVTDALTGEPVVAADAAVDAEESCEATGDLSGISSVEISVAGHKSVKLTGTEFRNACDNIKAATGKKKRKK